jgi:2-succinyl-5-enolpyruvyl-6-hydroxy-3-cyclohexene-1-carboxylate synthase
VRPQLALRVGDMPTSKPLRAWLGGAAQVVVDPHASWNEPTRHAETLLHADPARTCDALATALEARHRSVADDAWLERWRTADALVGPALAEAPDPFEPKLYAALEPLLPDGALVFVSSSMPIRHVESFFPRSARRIDFLANRGANGIDGVVASAAGAARATGRPTFLLIGEVALSHDVGGLLAATRAGIGLTIVCSNNGGGGIFDLLPVAEHAEGAAYEEHVATPTGIDLAALAALAGLGYRRVDAADGLAAAIAAGPALIELRTDRAHTMSLTATVTDAVSATLMRGLR